MNKYLDEKLIEYSHSDVYPFHMPGHKRQSLGLPLSENIDITEIDGFDNLHHAEEILKDANERIAEVFGAYKSYMLVNGSTSGILTAISAVTSRGDSILIGRNAHKAVYNGIYLRELKAHYIYPMKTMSGIQGSINPDDIEKALEDNSQIKAVLITSPTYDGVVSDMAGIAAIVHAHGIPLIVDEAHGAHFGFHEMFPQKALASGADICIESLHKTLPSYTQTAVLHVADSPYIDIARVERFLAIYQTSSPSYIFMAGMDRCTRILIENGRKLWEEYSQRLADFYQRTSGLENIQILSWGSSADEDPGIFSRDISKILISAGRRVSGQKLHDILLGKYHIQLEMASGHYATALTSLMDTEEGFDRLINALTELDKNINICETDSRDQDWTDSSKLLSDNKRIYNTDDIYIRNIKSMEIYEAMEMDYERVKLTEAEGYISTEFVYLYPPGIPILTPGEVISAKILDILGFCKDKGMNIEGLHDKTSEYIKCVKAFS